MRISDWSSDVCSSDLISPVKKPRFCASTAFSCEASAMRSWSSREIRKSAATFSAVSGIESTPYFDFLKGLTKRQPMVVSYTALAREKALSALGITNGERLMFQSEARRVGEEYVRTW